VPALRVWLTRKQRESRRGRAALRLALRTADWNAQPENRHLPAWWDWLNIRLLTQPTDWSAPQRRMMRRAAHYHAARGFAFLLLVLGLAWWGREWYGAMRAEGLIKSLGTADTANVLPLVAQLDRYRRWADPRLRAHFRSSAADSKEHLHAALALLPVDPDLCGFVSDRLLNASPHEVPVLRQALLPHQEALAEQLWVVVQRPPRDQTHQRLRAACALALYDPDSPRWDQVRDQVANDLVEAATVDLATWLACLRGVRERLLPPLEALFRDRKRPAVVRSRAADILADFAADRPEKLAELVLVADAKQYAVLMQPLRQGYRDQAIAWMQRRLQSRDRPPAGRSRPEEEDEARQQALAAVSLLHLGQPDPVWPLFRHSPDPEARAQLIWRAGLFGVAPGHLVLRLEQEPDVSTRRALILTLGEFTADQLPEDVRGPLIARLLQWYRDDPDAGIHGAIDWLLRHGAEGPDPRPLAWRRASDLQTVNTRLRSRDPDPRRHWYVNGQGQTLVVIPGPVEFRMGSPLSEAGRDDDETPHRRRIERSFAIASKLVTVEEFRRFQKDHTFVERYCPDPSGPVVSVSWYQAAQYCNWLSAREGIPHDQWCYPDNVAEGAKLFPDILRRTGYRLPTEAEWEYACGAGALTSRYYGSSEELLPRYAWYLANAQDRAWPVGQKRPNDLGLFDMLGNVWTWAQDTEAPYPVTPGDQPIEDVEIVADLKDSIPRRLRGASLINVAQEVRRACRGLARPGAARNNNFGIRVARTCN
jgi:formylglycine-generating enzyme required for sulfatase activity